MTIPTLLSIDTLYNPIRYVPRYPTGPRARCKFKMCGQCITCLQPEPKEHFKLSHTNKYGPKKIPPGGYYEMVRYNGSGDIIYYMYCPIYI